MIQPIPTTYVILNKSDQTIPIIKNTTTGPSTINLKSGRSITITEDQLDLGQIENLKGLNLLQVTEQKTVVKKINLSDGVDQEDKAFLPIYIPNMLFWICPRFDITLRPGDRVNPMRDHSPQNVGFWDWIVEDKTNVVYLKSNGLYNYTLDSLLSIQYQGDQITEKFVFPSPPLFTQQLDRWSFFTAINSESESESSFTIFCPLATINQLDPAGGIRISFNFPFTEIIVEAIQLNQAETNVISIPGQLANGRGLISGQFDGTNLSLIIRDSTGTNTYQTTGSFSSPTGWRMMVGLVGGSTVARVHETFGYYNILSTSVRIEVLNYLESQYKFLVE